MARKSTRTAATEQGYLKRALQEANAANKRAGRKLTPEEFATALLQRRSVLASASWRVIRTAAVFAFSETASLRPGLAKQAARAIAILDETDGGAGTERGDDLRTSQFKEKSLPDPKLRRICQLALQTRSPYAGLLVDALIATSLAGARLNEWPSARWSKLEDNGTFQLKLVNGKQGNLRSHGEFRTLTWTALPGNIASHATSWLAAARAAKANGEYDRLLDTLEGLLRRVTKKLYGENGQRPTLSSCRHAAVARWKHFYLSQARDTTEREEALAIIAALLGHASDDSASRHYARARGGSTFPIPTADPAEVALVRRRYLDRLVKPRRSKTPR